MRRTIEEQKVEIYFDVRCSFFLILAVTESVEECQNEYGTLMFLKFFLSKVSQLKYVKQQRLFYV
jgi:hypothetical protein